LNWIIGSIDLQAAVVLAVAALAAAAQVAALAAAVVRAGVAADHSARFGVVEVAQ